MKAFLLILFLSIPLLSICQGEDSKMLGALSTVKTDFPNSSMDGYNLYVPNSCKTSSKKYPVLVFLHGGYSVGGTVEKALESWLPRRIIATGPIQNELDRYIRDTFVVVIPHISSREFYNNETAMRAILEQVIQTENVDPNRIYLTGLSRGGYGTWGLASRMHDVFAAAAPICGGPKGISDYENLRKIPLWVTHNIDDGVVPYSASEGTVDQMEELLTLKFHRSHSIADANYLKHNRIFTAKDSDSHDAWTEMYSNPNFYKWLLRFQKK